MYAELFFYIRCECICLQGLVKWVVHILETVIYAHKQYITLGKILTSYLFFVYVYFEHFYLLIMLI